MDNLFSTFENDNIIKNSELLKFEQKLTDVSEDEVSDADILGELDTDGFDELELDLDGIDVETDGEENTEGFSGINFEGGLEELDKLLDSLE